jgi:hypothetical protein
MTKKIVAFPNFAKSRKRKKERKKEKTHVSNKRLHRSKKKNASIN